MSKTLSELKSTLINEGVLDNKLILLKKHSKEVAKLTDNNHHIGALLEIALYLTKKNTQYDRIYKAIESLENINKFFGHSPEGVISLEKEFRKMLMKALTPEEQKAFQEAL